MRFGCQARSFGDGIYRDEATFLDVLRQTGEVGFEGLETNWKNLDRYFARPADFAAILKNAKLTLIGAHMGGSPWGAASPEAFLGDAARTAQFVKAVGGSCIVFSGSLPKDKQQTSNTWRQMADFVNEVADVCAGKGIGLLYHNHWWECEGNGLQTLHALTDRRRVGFAFDTGHAGRAGKDPVALIHLLAGRLGLIHLGDWDDQLQTQVKRPPLGEGKMNLAAVAEALRKAAFNGWIVLEEETKVGAARPQVEKAFAIFQSTFPKGV
jgi:inosose dehydratase